MLTQCLMRPFPGRILTPIVFEFAGILVITGSLASSSSYSSPRDVATTSIQVSCSCYSSLRDAATSGF